MNLDKYDTTCVLAGLRLLQHHLDHNKPFPNHIGALFAEVEDEEGYPESEHIDSLCEDINCAEDCVPASVLQKLVNVVDDDIYTDAHEYHDRVGQARCAIESCKIILQELKHDEITTINDFVELVVRMQMDGEQNSNGVAFQMSHEDAFDTLNRLIAMARKIKSEDSI